NRLALRGEGTKGKGTHDPAKFLPQLPEVRVQPQWTTPRPPLFVPGKSKLNEVATDNERFLQELLESTFFLLCNRYPNNHLTKSNDFSMKLSFDLEFFDQINVLYALPHPQI
ncbi:unnamed protein product, partial [Adineta ricciae]